MMKAPVPCGALAVLILAACSDRPDPGLFAQGSAQSGTIQAAGASAGNSASAGSSGVGGAGVVTSGVGGAGVVTSDTGAAGVVASDTGGTTSLSIGGSAAVGSAGDPGALNNAGSAGVVSAAGALGSAGSTSFAGSVGTAGSPGAGTGAAGRAEPPPAVCGNGIIEAGEQCDDAGHAGNGCDASCKVVCSQHGQGSVESADYHCYAGYNQADFTGSQQDCVKRGAHLATISSAAENKLLRPLVSNSKWLGGNEDVAAALPCNGAYAWLTGEAFDFINWAPHEPNPGQAHCEGSNTTCYAHCIVMLGDGTWAAQRCDIVDGYVCEWEPAGTK
ncbi:MAG: lectin-like protein [Polyangiaceae bacterium]